MLPVLFLFYLVLPSTLAVTCDQVVSEETWGDVIYSLDVCTHSAAVGFYDSFPPTSQSEVSDPTGFSLYDSRATYSGACTPYTTFYTIKFNTSALPANYVDSLYLVVKLKPHSGTTKAHQVTLKVKSISDNWSSSTTYSQYTSNVVEDSVLVTHTVTNTMTWIYLGSSALTNYVMGAGDDVSFKLYIENSSATCSPPGPSTTDASKIVALDLVTGENARLAFTW